MSGTLLVGDGRQIRRVPDDAFLQAIARIPARMASRLAFMTQNHHAVRNFVVREMPRQQGALSPQHIANVTGLGLPNLTALLSDLEKRLFFLVRDRSGNPNRQSGRRQAEGRLVTWKLKYVSNGIGYCDLKIKRLTVVFYLGVRVRLNRRGVPII